MPYSAVLLILFVAVCNLALIIAVLYFVGRIGDHSQRLEALGEHIDKLSAELREMETLYGRRDTQTAENERDGTSGAQG